MLNTKKTLEATQQPFLLVHVRMEVCFRNDVTTFGVLQGPFNHDYWLWLVQFCRNLLRITIFLDRRACKLL